MTSFRSRIYPLLVSMLWWTGGLSPPRVLYVLVERAAGGDIALTASDGESAWSGDLKREDLSGMAGYVVMASF